MPSRLPKNQPTAAFRRMRVVLLSSLVLCGCRTENPSFGVDVASSRQPLRTAPHHPSTSPIDSEGVSVGFTDHSPDTTRDETSATSTSSPSGHAGATGSTTTSLGTSTTTSLIASTTGMSTTPTATFSTSTATTGLTSSQGTSTDTNYDPFPQANWSCPATAFSCYLFTGLNETPAKFDLKFQQMNDQAPLDFGSDLDSSYYSGHISLRGKASGIQSSAPNLIPSGTLRATIGLELGVRNLECQSQEPCMFFQFGSFFSLSYSSVKEELTATYTYVDSNMAVTTAKTSVPMSSQGSHYIRTGYHDNQLMLGVNFVQAGPVTVPAGNSHNGDEHIRFVSAFPGPSDGRIYGEIGWMRVYQYYNQIP